MSVLQNYGYSCYKRCLVRWEGMNTLNRDEALSYKPGNIFNMDETGCQLNNEPEIILASKGVKDIHCLTSSEKGENVSTSACHRKGQKVPRKRKPVDSGELATEMSESDNNTCTECHALKATMTQKKKLIDSNV